MKHRKSIFAGIACLLFVFAGYNLFSYFQTQQAIQIEEDRVAEERRIQKVEDAENREAQRLAQIEAEKRQAEAKELAAREAEERERAEKEASRLDREAEAKAERQAGEEARLNDRTTKARSLRHIEGLTAETIRELNQISADYILDHPEEFLGKQFSAQEMGASRQFVKLMGQGSSPLMLYAAISSDLDVIKALLDIGRDQNERNNSGYTALMFAAAYNTPEVARFLLGQGADMSLQAHVLNLNALHTASLFNPNPDTAEVLVQAGMALEQETENGYTPLLLAITENTNLEVAEQLAKLGANTKATDERGRSVHTLAEKRMQGEGSVYEKISDTVDERILRALK